jgi:hypothetical protein
MGRLGRGWVVREVSMPQYLVTIKDLYERVTQAL